jgi:hypothetical protein
VLLKKRICGTIAPTIPISDDSTSRIETLPSFRDSAAAVPLQRASAQTVGQPELFQATRLRISCDRRRIA